MPKMTDKKHEKIVNDLEKLDYITIRFFGEDVKASIKEWGIAINGYYIVFETFSPEGYHVKFAIFDDDLLKLKY